MSYIYEYHPDRRELMVLVIAPLNTLIEDEIRYLRGKDLSVGALQTKKSSTSFDFDDEFEFSSETESSDNEQNEDICDDKLSYIENGKFRLLFLHPEGFSYIMQERPKNPYE